METAPAGIWALPRNVREPTPTYQKDPGTGYAKQALPLRSEVREMTVRDNDFMGPDARSRRILYVFLTYS